MSSSLRSEEAVAKLRMHIGNCYASFPALSQPTLVIPWSDPPLDFQGGLNPSARRSDINSTQRDRVNDFGAPVLELPLKTAKRKTANRCCGLVEIVLFRHLLDRP